MYTPHTVTVINAVEKNDGTMEYYATVLRGVMLQASKRNGVTNAGLTDVDSVRLFIPFSVSAVGAGGATKRFVKPKVYESAQDKQTLWTLKSGGPSGASDCFFVKGELSGGISYSQALETFDDVFRVTNVDTFDYGSAAMQHWEVGGR